MLLAIPSLQKGNRIREGEPLTGSHTARAPSPWALAKPGRRTWNQLHIRPSASLASAFSPAGCLSRSPGLFPGQSQVLEGLRTQCHHLPLVATSWLGSLLGRDCHSVPSAIFTTCQATISCPPAVPLCQTPNLLRFCLVFHRIPESGTCNPRAAGPGQEHCHLGTRCPCLFPKARLLWRPQPQLPQIGPLFLLGPCSEQSRAPPWPQALPPNLTWSEHRTLVAQARSTGHICEC